MFSSADFVYANFQLPNFCSSNNSSLSGRSLCKGFQIWFSFENPKSIFFNVLSALNSSLIKQFPSLCYFLLITLKLS